LAVQILDLRKLRSAQAPLQLMINTAYTGSNLINKIKYGIISWISSNWGQEPTLILEPVSLKLRRLALAVLSACSIINKANDGNDTTGIDLII